MKNKQPEVDTSNTDKNYWEEVLETHLLGLKQLSLHQDHVPEDDDAGPGATIVTQGRRVFKDWNRDFEQLRTKVDSMEPFTNKGLRIIKTRSRKKPIPDWALNDIKTRQLLLRLFPNLKRPGRDRRRAARWASIIHMYYRMNLTSGQIAKELRSSPSKIKLTLQRIRWAVAGYRTDHRKLRTIPSENLL